MCVALVAAANTTVSLLDRLSRTLARTGPAPETVSKSSSTASYLARLSCSETSSESSLDSAWMPSSLETPLKVVRSRESAVNTGARTAEIWAIATPTGMGGAFYPWGQESQTALAGFAASLEHRSSLAVYYFIFVTKSEQPSYFFLPVSLIDI